jgi:nucleoside-specific outer membrane channel protein Tsx
MCNVFANSFHKKQNLVLKLSSTREFFLSFLLMTQKNIGFLRNLAYTHRLRHIRTHVWFDFFKYFKLFFLVAEAYAPKIKNAFPLLIMFYVLLNGLTELYDMSVGFGSFSLSLAIQNDVI